MTIEHIKLITAALHTTVSNLITSSNSESTKVERSKHYLGLPYSCYFTAISANTRVRLPTSHVDARGQIFLQTEGLIAPEASAGFIKRPFQTGIPTQFTLAIASTADLYTNEDDRVLHQLRAQATRKAVENFVVSRHNEQTYVQQTGIPIKDLKPAFRQVSQAIENQQDKVTLATCHVQLSADKYYAHIGVVGNNMVVVLGRDGSIKYQTGAVTYKTDANSSTYLPTSVNDLFTTEISQYFRNQHFFQHDIALETGDVIMLLSHGAWSGLDRKEQVKTANYTVKDNDDNFGPIRVFMNEINLSPGALRHIKSQHSNLAQMSHALTATIFQQAQNYNEDVRTNLRGCLDAINASAKAVTMTINAFIDQLSYSELQTDSKLTTRTSLRHYLRNKRYDLDAPGQLYKLWEEYRYHPNPAFEMPRKIWEFLPFCPENTEAFLSQFEIITGKNSAVSLLRELYNSPTGGGVSTMMLVVPDFKTEIIRSWIENNDEEVRSNLLELLITKKLTLDDLGNAILTLRSEIYALPDQYDNQSASSIPLQLEQRYANLDRDVESSCIRAYLTASIKLLQFPAPLNLTTIISMSFAPRIKQYTKIIDDFMTTCINDGGLLKSDKIASIATKELIKYCHEILLPKIFQEMDEYLDKAGIKDENILQTLMDELLTIRNQMPFNLTIQRGNTWKFRTDTNRSPSQIKIDEKIAKLQVDIKSCLDKKKLGSNMDFLLKK